MNNIPPIHTLSRASQLSLIAVVILLGAIFFTVNGALQEQNTAGHASGGTNIVLNPSFESGKTNWIFDNWSPGAGTFSTTTSTAADGATSAVLTVTASTPDNWDVQIKQSVGVQAGQTYTVTFWAKASTTRQIATVIQGASSPYTVYGSMNPTLSTTWKQYSYTFKATGTDPTANIAFNVAQATGTVWLDGISYTSGTAAPTTVPVLQPTAIPVTTQSGGNLLQNASFESGTTGWYLNQNWPASGSFTTSSTAEDGAKSALVTVNSTGTNDWYLQLEHDGLPMTAGHTYTYSFWAKANASRPIDALVQQTASPYAVYAEKVFTATTSWQKYSFSFTPTTTQSNVAVEFNLAQNTGQVWIDNVSYSEGSGASPTATSVPPTSTPTPTAVPLPPAPTGVTATPGDGTVTLNWNAIGGDYYYIYVEDVSAGQTSFTKLPYPVTTNTFTDTPLTNGHTYEFKVSAINTAGKEGPLSAAVSAIPSISAPTAAPTSIPTILPTALPTAIPTAIPQPTETPIPGSTVLAVNIALHGIGNGGDSASPNSQGNMTPLRPTRTVTADVYNTQNQLVVSQQGTMTYDSTSGKFNGTIDLGTGFQSGPYTVKLKTDQYLRALVPGIQTITAGQSNAMPGVTLIAGDINGDNAINIVDYNILIGCYSDLLPATNCNATDNVLADLTDDGHVNQFDYNLFLRELTNIGGQ